VPPPPAGQPPPDKANAARPQAAPSSFGAKDAQPIPSVAIAEYDPRTGRYVGPDEKFYQQSDLASSAAPKKWQDMLPT
jgi:hypothetical protein